MPPLDHLAVWTAHRDRLAGRLAELTGFPVLDGFAPEGRTVARGVRLAGGAFLDLHQIGPEAAAGEVFLGLRGSVDAVEALAARQGWGVRVSRWREASDGAPWSILSFRRGHGLLNKLFVIEYAREPVAWASPVFDHELYRLEASPTQGAALRRVWLSTRDLEASGAALEALGFVAAGEISSQFAPGEGRLYRGAAGDLALSLGPAEAVIRFDIDGLEVSVAEPFGERLSLVSGDTPVTNP